jgi:hypothetical protein
MGNAAGGHVPPATDKMPSDGLDNHSLERGPPMWCALGVLALAVPAVYVFLVGKTAHTSQGVKADEATRSRYFEAVKTLVTAAGVAIAILAAGLRQSSSSPTGILRYAALSLVFCVVLSACTMLEMSRVYERASGASLKLEQLWSVLVLGYLALVTFLLGFLFLARFIADG